MGEREESLLTPGLWAAGKGSGEGEKGKTSGGAGTFAFGGSFSGAWRGTGYEELSFGHVKFEMPITHLRRDT